MENLKKQSEFFIQTLTHYIDFNGDSKKYSEYLNNKVSEMQKQQKEQGNDSKGTITENPIRK